MTNIPFIFASSGENIAKCCIKRSMYVWGIKAYIYDSVSHGRPRAAVAALTEHKHMSIRPVKYATSVRGTAAWRLDWPRPNMKTSRRRPNKACTQPKKLVSSSIFARREVHYTEHATRALLMVLMLSNPADETPPRIILYCIDTVNMISINIISIIRTEA